MIQKCIQQHEKSVKLKLELIHTEKMVLLKDLKF